MSTNKPKLSIFFGAGAELSYGMPNGGEFALNIFREDQVVSKKLFKEEINKINSSSFQASQWLPEDYQSKQISTFSKTQHENLLKSSLEYKKHVLLEYLNSFDTKFESLLKKYDVNIQRFDNFVRSDLGIDIDNIYYTHKAKFSSKLTNDFKLFEQKYFSLLLELLKNERISAENLQKLKIIAKSFIEFGVGIFGSELIKELNEGLFEKKPEEIDIFDDISGMFSINTTKIGLDGLSLILNTQTKEQTVLKEQFKEIKKEDIVDIYFLLLESTIKEILDYQDLIDANFRYLYSPKTNWAKFSKISIFLYNVHNYINKINDKIKDELETLNDGYYHDLEKLKKDFELVCIGTSNYTNFIYEYVAKEKVIHLNGSIDERYDPYKNTITTSTYDSFSLPFLFTQSGTKPMTSIKVSLKYTQLYEHYKNSDYIVIIGYGFNVDDGHINGLFRTLVEDDGKSLIILAYDNSHDKKYYQKKLRLSNSSNMKVLNVDNDRNVDNLVWYKSIKSK